jgi:hypothetical protein
MLESMNRLALERRAQIVGMLPTPEGFQRYDKFTEYKVDSADGGFTITVIYSQYQYSPDLAAIATACKSALTALAYDIAEKQGKKLEPINEQRIRLATERNLTNGVTSCVATTPAQFAKSN